MLRTELPGRRRRFAAVMGVVLTATGATAWGVGASQDAAAAAGTRVITFREVGHGSRGDSGTGEGARGRVLRTAAGAKRVLRAWELDRAVSEITAVDFARDSLIVVLAASQPSTGYRARISRVAAQGRTAVATTSVRRPDGVMDGQAISRPWVVIAVRRTAVAGVRGVRVRVVR